jgi:hypothetical protein
MGMWIALGDWIWDSKQACFLQLSGAAASLCAAAR